MDRFTQSVLPLDAVAPSAFDELSLWSAPFGLKLLEVVTLRRGITALDVGCGAGFPLIELAQRLGPTAHVHGVDPWVTALARAREKLGMLGVGNVTLHEARAEQLPLANGSVDLIVSNNGLNNVDDIEASFAECARVARSGAQMVYAYNLPETMQAFYSLYGELLDERGLTKERQALAAHINAKRKPLAYTSSLFARVGFHVERVIEDSFTWRFADASALFAYFFTRVAFLKSWLEVLAPHQREPLFSELERRLNAQAQDSSGLSLTIPFACFDCRRALRDA